MWLRYSSSKNTFSQGNGVSFWCHVDCRVSVPSFLLTVIFHFFSISTAINDWTELYFQIWLDFNGVFVCNQHDTSLLQVSCCAFRRVGLFWGPQPIYTEISHCPAFNFNWIAQCLFLVCNQHATSLLQVSCCAFRRVGFFGGPQPIYTEINHCPAFNFN